MTRANALALTTTSPGENLLIGHPLTDAHSVCIVFGMVEKRTERLHALLSKEEAKMLEELAEAQGLTASDVVRLLIRREHHERSPMGRKKRLKP
jgi:hypothetical protein